MGLAKQVLASLYKKNIQRLTKTFLTLSVVDVVNRAKLTGVEQAESYIVDMVR
jgi:COP9 signalosome complex subunit 3